MANLRIDPNQKIPIPKALEVLVDLLVEQAVERDPLYLYEVSGYTEWILGCELEDGMLADRLPELERIESSFSGPIELHYCNHPFEFFPVGWQGGDALQYGYLVHTLDPPPDDFPMGSFSPADGGSKVCWLGDNTW